MPRASRVLSETQVYHIMIRGVNKQEIFLDNDDKAVFISLLKKVKEKFDFNIYAYVLMNNHIHLEIKDNENCISKIIHKLTTSYALYYNNKYDRVGHLFQDRFRSNPVEDDRYLLNLVRYIHQNPEKARIELTEKYKWSSYFDYINQKRNLVDIDFILNIIDQNKKLALIKFKDMHKKILELESSKDILEYEMKNMLEDYEIIEILQKTIGIEKIKNIKEYTKEGKIKLISKIKYIKGISTLNLAKILDIDVRIVREAFKRLSQKEQNM